jgi:hypothetical protein
MKACRTSSADSVSLVSTLFPFRTQIDTPKLPAPGLNDPPGSRYPFSRSAPPGKPTGTCPAARGRELGGVVPPRQDRHDGGDRECQAAPRDRAVKLARRMRTGVKWSEYRKKLSP